MDNLVFGFYLGMSLILAVGPQNLFVIEQGLKRNYVFMVCSICSLSDLIFIVIGTVAFAYLSQLSPILDLALNLLLLVFIFNFIHIKLSTLSNTLEPNFSKNKETVGKVVIKTLAFTYLNPHVYSDTIFIIGSFSRELNFSEKIFFILGAAIASFIYFFSLGYASSYFANFINNQIIWRWINRFVIFTMLLLSIYVSEKIITLFWSIN